MISIFTTESLHACSQAALDSLPKEALVDLCTVPIDCSVPVSGRLIQYAQALQNPYLFRVGDIAVKIRFQPEGKNLQQAVASALLSR